MYKRTKLACEALGVHPNTLRAWANSGKIKYIRQPNGHRLYDVSSVENADRAKARICYCRVSSAKQRDDLGRQVAYMHEIFPDHEIVTDIGSGVNFNRKGFTAILERVVCGDVGEIVVAHRDRLCRFGFDLFRQVVELHGGKVLVLDNPESSPERELVSDVISIIHIFACRVPELRKYTTQIAKDPDLPHGSPAGDPEADIGNIAGDVQ